MPMRIGHSSNKFGAQLSDNLEASLVARYIDATLRFTGDDFSTFPATPAASQSVQRVNQLYTRGGRPIGVPSTARSRIASGWATRKLIRGKKTQTRALESLCQPANLGQRLQYDWQGEAALLQYWTLIGVSKARMINCSPSQPSRGNANKAGYLQLFTMTDFFWPRTFATTPMINS